MKLITKHLKSLGLIFSLPEPLKRMAKEGYEINCKIRVSYDDLKSRVGEVKADELIAKFRDEAFTGREVNHKYMIRKMDSYEE